MSEGAVTRADLTDAVLQEVGLARQECAGLVDHALELVARSLEDGEQVKLSGFGVFQVRDKRARVGRNPKTGVAAEITPRRVISFRASQLLKAKVESAHAEPLSDAGSGDPP